MADRSRSVYITGIPAGIESDKLKEMLDPDQKKVDHLFRDSESTAFLVMKNKDLVGDMVAEFDHKEIKGQEIRVQLCPGEKGKQLEGLLKSPDKSSPASGGNKLDMICQLLGNLTSEDLKTVVTHVQGLVKPQLENPNNATGPSLKVETHVEPSTYVWPTSGHHQHTPASPAMSHIYEVTTTPHRLSQFSGESQKGEGSFELWKAEVKSLEETHVPAASTLLAIRKSLRGRAAEVLLHMGTPVTVTQIINKFNNIFGNVLPPEVLLEQYYSARQHQQESASSWACRLESILSQLHDRDPSSGHQTQGMLRSKFWSGLRDLSTKNALREKYERPGLGIDELLVAARLMEEELKASTAAQVQAQQMTAPQSPYDQILKELAKLNQRMDSIEKGKTSTPTSRARGPDSSGFNGKCFRCNQRGHRQADCPGN